MSAVVIRIRRLSVTAALAIALSPAACAHRGPYPGWAMSKSKNVTVYTEAKIEHEFMQEWLELSHAAYSALLPNVQTGPVDAVWLVNEPGGTRFYTPDEDPRAGWTLETLPSGGAIGRNGLIVLERKDDLGWGPRGMIATSTRDENLAKSQMAHLFIMKAVPSAPLWLQIGLARYMSRYRIHHKQDYWIACFGSPVFDESIRTGSSADFDLNGRLRTGTTGNGRRVTIPMEELTNLDWYQYDGKRRYWYEYTSYALVHYLIHGENGFNRTRFPILLGALRDGKNQADALALAYPQVLPNEWDDKLEAYVRPKERRMPLVENPAIAQGLCFRIPAANDAAKKPQRSPADPRAVQVMMEDLERVDPFHRHADWMPQEIVEAEAAKHPRPSPAGQKSGKPGSAPPSDETPERQEEIPSIRTPANPPPKE